MLLVGSLTTCGHEPIKPSIDVNSLFKLEGFVLPQPLGKGNTTSVTPTKIELIYHVINGDGITPLSLTILH